MSKEYAVLPCNGLDKCAGCIARELAVELTEKSGSKIICPVFCRVADTKYKQLAGEMPLLVIDGCSTRCASKLAAEKGLKISEKVNITEIAKERAVELPKGLRLDSRAENFIHELAEKLLAEKEENTVQEETAVDYPQSLGYEEYRKEKFVFRVPTNNGFYFNENDVWVYVSGNRARIGVTDFVQKSLSDIMFFTPPEIGCEVEQFDSVGDIESGKAVFEIVCPVSGIVTAVNEELLESPELINQNPYEQGWIAEMTLTDFESDKELLHQFEGYYPILKGKVDQFHV